MNVRHIRIPAATLLEGKGTPEGTRVVSCSLDEPKGEVVVAIEHDSFDLVEENEPVPMHVAPAPVAETAAPAEPATEEKSSRARRGGAQG